MRYIEVPCCQECPHNGHTGAFTHGGAKRTCDHLKAPKFSDGRLMGNGRPLLDPKDSRNFPKEIPGWCPLITKEDIRDRV